MATSPTKRRPWLHVLLFSRRMVYLFRSRRRRCRGRKNYVPMMGSKLLGSEKGQQRTENIRTLVYLHQLFYNYDIQILVYKPLIIVPSRVHMLQKRLRAGT